MCSFFFEDEDPLPKPPKLPIGGGAKVGMKRSGSQRNLTRTNSVDRFDKPLRISGRRRERDWKDDGMPTPDQPIYEEDNSVIAVFSREAAENFARKWRTRVNSGDPLSRVTKSSLKGLKADKSAVSKAVKRQKVTSTGTDEQSQIRALLEDKTTPHVIAVVEGQQVKDQISLNVPVKDEIIPLEYTRVHFQEGATKAGSKDDKQSVSVYVRNDLRNAYRVGTDTVHRGKDPITVVSVDYQTVDGEKFRTLVVHIPNEFVGSVDKDGTTHQAFRDYAANAAKQKVHVTSYIGDTNYKKPMHTASVPSEGGHLPTGETVSPQASSAKGETNFMQAVSLRHSPKQPFEVRQPSTLNYVLITPDAQNRAATDHPSIMSYTSHSSQIAGRNPLENRLYYA